MVLRVTSQGEGFGDPKRRKLNGCWEAEPYLILPIITMSSPSLKKPPAMLLKPLLNRVHPVKGYYAYILFAGSRMASRCKFLPNRIASTTNMVAPSADAAAFVTQPPHTVC